MQTEIRQREIVNKMVYKRDREVTGRIDVVKKVKMFQRNSMTFVFGVAVLLLLGAYIVPMKTSIGQGVEERTAVGWQAVLSQQTHKEFYRMNFADGSFLQFAITGIPQNLFQSKTKDGYLGTTEDLPVVIDAAYRQNPTHLERTLGTYHNAPSLFHPFSEVPIAYSTNFLKVLAQKSINLKAYGGPDISPGSVDLSKLPGGVLHIDTKANDNTLVQCAPGQTPYTLNAVKA